MCNLFLLYNDPLGQHLHGVDPLCISFAYLKDLSEGSLANELEDLEIFWTICLFVCLLKLDLKTYLASNMICCRISWFESKPSVEGL